MCFLISVRSGAVAVSAASCVGSIWPKRPRPLPKLLGNTRAGTSTEAEFAFNWRNDGTRYHLPGKCRIRPPQAQPSYSFSGIRRPQGIQVKGDRNTSHVRSRRGDQPRPQRHQLGLSRHPGLLEDVFEVGFRRRPGDAEGCGGLVKRATAEKAGEHAGFGGRQTEGGSQGVGTILRVR
jgi:hypothetical protein